MHSDFAITSCDGRRCLCLHPAHFDAETLTCKISCCKTVGEIFVCLVYKTVAGKRVKTRERKSVGYHVHRYCAPYNPNYLYDILAARTSSLHSNTRFVLHSSRPYLAPAVSFPTAEMALIYSPRLCTVWTLELWTWTVMADRVDSEECPGMHCTPNANTAIMRISCPCKSPLIIFR
jgi:hypothetical protein